MVTTFRIEINIIKLEGVAFLHAHSTCCAPRALPGPVMQFAPETRASDSLGRQTRVILVPEVEKKKRGLRQRKDESSATKDAGATCILGCTVYGTAVYSGQTVRWRARRKHGEASSWGE